jgi:hypothetical protein
MKPDQSDSDVSPEALEEFLLDRGVEIIDPNAAFQAGRDPYAYEHGQCGGRITKLAPGLFESAHARCERCAKQGPIGPLLEYDKDGELNHAYREVFIEDTSDGFVPLAVFLTDEPQIIS